MDENNLYDEWNKVKKDISKNKRRLSIKSREIYWAKIGYNVGCEQYGKGKQFVRPLIVIRQLTHDLFIGVPTTTTNKDENDYFQPISYKDDLSRDIKSSAMILQQKVFSKKRLLSKIGNVKKEEFEKITTKLKRLIDPAS